MKEGWAQKERNITKRGAEEPSLWQPQASEPVAATATEPPKCKGGISNKTPAPAAASQATRCQQEAESKCVSKTGARHSASVGSASVDEPQPPKQPKPKKDTATEPSSKQQTMTSSRSSSDSSNDAEQNDLCVVCLDSRCTHAFVPCGHLCICSTCAIQTDLQKCPICRVPSQHVMQIYTT